MWKRLTLTKLLKRLKIHCFQVDARQFCSRCGHRRPRTVNSWVISISVAAAARFRFVLPKPEIAPPPMPTSCMGSRADPNSVGSTSSRQTAALNSVSLCLRQRGIRSLEWCWAADDFLSTLPLSPFPRWNKQGLPDGRKLNFYCFAKLFLCVPARSPLSTAPPWHVKEKLSRKGQIPSICILSSDTLTMANQLLPRPASETILRTKPFSHKTRQLSSLFLGFVTVRSWPKE